MASDGYEPFNYERQRARIAAGFKDETKQFQSMATWPKLTFVDGRSPTVVDMFKPVTSDIGSTIDPWGQRKRG